MIFVLFWLYEFAMALADPAEHEHTLPRRGRCTTCGHRIGDNVPATRDLPVRQWPREISGRVHAKYGQTLARRAA